MKVYDTTINTDKQKQKNINFINKLKRNNISGNYIIIGEMDIYNKKINIYPAGVYNNIIQIINTYPATSGGIQVFIKPYNQVCFKIFHEKGVDQYIIKQLTERGLNSYNKGVGLDEIVYQHQRTIKNCGKII